ncbi:MAG: hypothetical protein AAGJ35_14055 [Myxococcota bacterium]
MIQGSTKQNVKHVQVMPQLLPPGTFFVEWYRPSPLKPLLAMYGIGSLLLLSGSFLLGMVFVHPDWSSFWKASAALFGMLLTCSGPIFVVLSFTRLFRQDTVLALRNDGLFFQSEEQCFFVPWQELERIDVDQERKRLHLICEGAQGYALHETFLGQTHQLLAERVWSVRRQALMGLLRAPKSSF